jgi:hypothetical protein
LDFFRDTPMFAALPSGKISLEMAGRELRYAFFNRIAVAIPTRDRSAHTFGRPG